MRQSRIETPALPVPASFLERMKILLGDEFDAFLASYDVPPVQGLRANTLKTDPRLLAERLPFHLDPIPWSAETFVVSADEKGSRPGKHPYHLAGLYYLQDPSATAPVELLDPQPGERILDLSAAPGGKSTHIASRLRGRGLLIANELIHKRAWELAGNLERWGATNVAITSESPDRLAERWPGFFDAVLVDAPCSGEGMFRKGDAARREWSPALVEGCAVRQDYILYQAAVLVRPGGRLVYSTCTFSPEEDEGAVSRFLRAHPEFSLEEPPSRSGFEQGRPDWLPPDLARPDLARSVRLWPHHVPGEGHFAALLRKGEDADGGDSIGLQTSPPVVKDALNDYTTFVDENLRGAPTDARLFIAGGYLYALPEGLPNLAGLRYLHPGWWLGEVKKDRFEPSHALALAVRSEEAKRFVDFVPGNPELLAYLRGETVESPGDDGWALVTVDGFPMGWAKRVRGRLKSHYPKGLRLSGG